jgi:hypothetical protein
VTATATKAVLRVEVLADGTAKVVGDLNRVAGASGAVGRGAAGAGRSMQVLNRAYSGTSRMVGGLVRTMTSFGGVLGVTLGGAAIVKAVGAVRDFDQGLLNLRHSSGASSDEIKRVGIELTDMAVRAGRPREELLAAARAAVNLGVGLDAVVKNLEAASNWARLLGVSVQEVAPALAAVGKIAGEGVSIETQMAMTDVAVRRSGLSESDALKVIEKLAPRMAAAGMEGEEGLRTMVEVMAATGRFMSNPDEIIAGWKGLQGAIARDKDLREQLGVTSEDVMGAFHRLAGIAHHDARQLDRMGLPNEVRGFVMAAGQGMDEMSRAGDELANLDVGEFKDKLNEAATSQGADWDRFKVQLQQALIPLGEGALKWLADHKDQLIAALEGFLAGLLRVSTALVDSFEALKGVGEEIGATGAAAMNVGMEIAQGGTGANAVLAESMRRDPEQRRRMDRVAARVAGGELSLAELPEHMRSTVMAESSEVRAKAQAIQASTGMSPEDIFHSLAGLLTPTIENNIRIRVDPETVHTEADTRQDGRRAPVRSTTEAEIDRSLS